MQYNPIDLAGIKSLDFPENQYYRNVTPKKQLCIHHTASGKGIDGDFKHWLSDSGRIATPIVIGYDGIIYQLFHSQFWGHHLGIKPQVFHDYDIPPYYRKDGSGKAYHANNNALNEACIGIELDAWGPVVLHNGHYKSYTGTVVNINEVQLYREPFKLYPSSPFFDQIGVTGKPVFHYQKYSPEQIYSLAQLLILWCDGYKIPKAYNENMWDVSREALKGTPGIWTHVSYRPDKSDCHPQPELVAMLKSI